MLRPVIRSLLPRPHSLRPALLLGLCLLIGQLGYANEPTTGQSAVNPANAKLAEHEPEATHLHRLQYGTLLYEFFQKNYFSALNQLYVGRKQGRMQENLDEVSLLEAGMHLSLGLHQQAYTTFEDLLARSDNPQTRDQAWFHLARIKYMLGDEAQAYQAFRQIGEQLPKAFAGEYHFKLANLLLAQQSFDEAESHLKAIDSDSLWKAYGYFNLASAHATQEQGRRAFAKHLSRAQNYLQAGAESAALNDRMHLFAAHYYLHGGYNRSAVKHLSKVRLAGPYSQAAMLTYGWAYAEQWQYESAVRIWKYLQDSTHLADPSVQESYLTIPYALERLEAGAQALGAFELGAAQYETELVRITRTRSQLREGRLLDQLIGQQDQAELGLFARQPLVLPGSIEALYLAEMMASGDFYHAFYNLRDLVSLRLRLQLWREKLSTFNLMLEHRQTSYADKAARLNRKELDQRYAQYQQRLSQLKQFAEQASVLNDWLALADTQQVEHLKRLQRVEKNLDFLTKRPLREQKNLANYQQRHKILRGRLLWLAQEDHSRRRWQVQQQLVDIEQLLAASEVGFAKIQQAFSHAPRGFAGYAETIGQLQSRIDQLLVVTAKLIHQQRAELIDRGDQVLVRRHEQIEDYLIQSRLAIARLYDQAASRHLATLGNPGPVAPAIENSQSTEAADERIRWDPSIDYSAEVQP